METSTVKTYIDFFDEDKGKMVSRPVVLGVKCRLDDTPKNIPGDLAETEAGERVKVEPTIVFYSAQHKTISVRRPVSPVRYRSGSLMFTRDGLPMCTKPVKNSMTMSHFKRTHSDRFVEKVTNAINEELGE